MFFSPLFSPIKLGLGLFINFMSLLFLAIFVRSKIRTQEDKWILRIFASFGISTVISLIFITFLKCTSYLKYPHLLLIFGFFWTFLLVMLIFPLAIICRNENLKNFIFSQFYKPNNVTKRTKTLEV